MDVGQINQDGSFDITDIDENDQILVQSDTNGIVKTRWLYRNTDNKLIIHERSEAVGDISPIGSFLEIGEEGFATVSLSKTYDNTKCGKLLTSIDWNDLSRFHSQNVVIDGESYVAVLAPVRLI